MSDIAKKKSEHLDAKLRVDSQINIFEHQLCTQFLFQVLEEGGYESE